MEFLCTAANEIGTGYWKAKRHAMQPNQHVSASDEATGVHSGSSKAEDQDLGAASEV